MVTCRERGDPGARSGRELAMKPHGNSHTRDRRSANPLNRPDNLLAANTLNDM
jgi:hypothetical protein